MTLKKAKFLFSPSVATAPAKPMKKAAKMNFPSIASILFCAFRILEASCHDGLAPSMSKRCVFDIDVTCSSFYSH